MLNEERAEHIGVTRRFKQTPTIIWWNDFKMFSTLDDALQTGRVGFTFQLLLWGWMFSGPSVLASVQKTYTRVYYWSAVLVNTSFLYVLTSSQTISYPCPDADRYVLGRVDVSVPIVSNLFTAARFKNYLFVGSHQHFLCLQRSITLTFVLIRPMTAACWNVRMHTRTHTHTHAGQGH